MMSLLKFRVHNILVMAYYKTNLSFLFLQKCRPSNCVDGSLVYSLMRLVGSFIWGERLSPTYLCDGHKRSKSN